MVKIYDIVVIRLYYHYILFNASFIMSMDIDKGKDIFYLIVSTF